MPNKEVPSQRLRRRLFDDVLVTCNTLLYIAILILVVIQIVVRYFTAMSGFTLPWTEELAKNLLVATTFIGAAVAMAGNEHIQITSIRDRFNLTTKLIVETICYVSIVGFSILGVSGSIKMVKSTKHSLISTIRWLKVGHIYAIIGVCFLIYIFYSLRWIYTRVKEVLEVRTRLGVAGNNE